MIIIKLILENKGKSKVIPVLS